MAHSAIIDKSMVKLELLGEGERSIRVDERKSVQINKNDVYKVQEAPQAEEQSLRSKA
jgi:hypothetical protein